MSKREKNVFKQIVSEMKRIADNVEEATTVLYVLGTEIAMLNDKLQSFMEKPINTTVKVTEMAEVSEKVTALVETKKPAPIEAVLPKDTYPKPEGAE